ncbi:hypothetical protein [Caloranaerobacter sp. DY30410]|uniref:hypothetical protein n=1 Tax=Caloranaerobacter sp. DY30410 TaxID=3238305 RepID=UPI003D06D87B
MLVLIIPNSLVFAQEKILGKSEVIKNSAVIIENTSKISSIAEMELNRKLERKSLNDVRFTNVQFTDKLLLLDGSVYGKKFKLNLEMKKFYQSNDILVGIGNDSLNNFNLIHMSFNSIQGYIKEIFSNSQKTLNIYLKDKSNNQLIFIEIDVDKSKLLSKALNYFNKNIESLDICDSREILWLSKVFEPVSTKFEENHNLVNTLSVVATSSKFYTYTESYAFNGTTYDDVITMSLEFEYPVNGVINSGDYTKAQLKILNAYQHDTYFDKYYWDINMFTVDEISIQIGVSDRGYIDRVQRGFIGYSDSGVTINASFALSLGFVSLNLNYTSPADIRSENIYPTTASNACDVNYDNLVLTSIGTHHATAQAFYKQYDTNIPGYTDFHAKADFRIRHNITGIAKYKSLSIYKNLMFDL